MRNPAQGGASGSLAGDNIPGSTPKPRTAQHLASGNSLGGMSAATGRPRGYIANYRPQERTRALLDVVMAVLVEYKDHLPLTSRQIFYRLVGTYGYEKTETFYAKLCHHIALARRGRRIPFGVIRDDGVATFSLEHYANADDFRAHLRLKAKNYRRDLLAGQAVHVEIWCEAAGMLPQLHRVAAQYSVNVFSSSGFDRS